ncbi:MAG TPA: hydantoinase/oxoprolinase family protein [Solirubrobacter sp.]|nr:hydantoinase/oxoprolinase family protein [Solirubrobacter sp.]
MSGSIEIDIGGTFTDCYVRVDDAETWCKTRTTPFDLSKGMGQAIDQAARQLELDTSALLERVGIVRYSTTLAMNKLIEHKGPRLALITTEGFEDTLLVGRGSQWSDGLPFKEQRNIAAAAKPRPLIPKELTVGVKERVDYRGEVMRPLDEDHFLTQLDRLVDQGVRGFVVSLLWAFLNPVHEQRIRELIEQEYNESYLGSMPVFLSSEVSPRKFEYTRTTMTVLNAYLHQSMYEELIGIGQQLRGGGYRKPLMMVHNTGGMASVFRSAAVHTYNGGPVAGLMGSSALGREDGHRNVVITDMGGTSFDIAMVVEGSTRFYKFAPTIDRWTVDATILDTRSIGSGGGSIAHVNELLDNRLEVGPESAGAMPGPACYDQGGREPTVTDADLLLGYLSPERFHGGQLALNRRRAERAVRDRVAGPLGVEVDEAALLIKRIIDAKMGAEIYKETVLKGYDPRDFVIFAAGGAGPAHACGYAEAARMRRVVVFPFSSTFCAYGSSTMDVLHVYERSRRFTVLEPGRRGWLTDYDAFNAVVAELEEHAVRDYAGEGFDPSLISYELELDMKFGGQLNVKRVAAPLLRVSGQADMEALYAAFEREFSEAYSPLGLHPDAGVEIEAFVLKARLPQPVPERLSAPLADPDPSSAQTGSRRARFDTGWVDTPVYDRDALLPGHTIPGPALVEAGDTTVVVAPRWTLEVDARRALVLTLEEEAGDV